MEISLELRDFLRIKVFLSHSKISIEIRKLIHVYPAIVILATISSDNFQNVSPNYNKSSMKVFSSYEKIILKMLFEKLSSF